MERKERYRQKMNFIVSRITDIPRRFDTSLAVDATLYRLQTAIDACMDLVAMVVKDKGRDVADDYGNIHQLQEISVIDKKLAAELTMLNGLRNAIVHKYNSFEEQTVVDDIPKIKRIIMRFLECLEHELKTNNTKHKA